MKRSKKVTLVLITAALASCNRYLSPAYSGSGLPADKNSCDSCETESIYADPVYDSGFGPLLSQWIYAFNPYAYNYYYYGPSRRGRFVRRHDGHRLSRPARSGILRGGWGRTGHISVVS